MRHRGIETPACMAGRPVDHRGFPVPWFVTEKDAEGRWDFAQITPARLAEAIRRDVCWVSGTRLGRWRSFVIGPMCIINRIAADPPVRRDVALWSVRICPFLSQPMAKRDERFDENVIHSQRGVAVARNPGVAAIYSTDRARYTRHGVFELGEPQDVTWWARGRPASPEEVWASVDSGLPILMAAAAKDGEEGMEAARRALERATAILPPRPAPVLA